MPIATFFHEGGKYQLYFSQGAFALTLNPSFTTLKAKYGTYTSFYINDEVIDDGHAIKNPFFVIQTTMNLVSEYVRQNRLSYFYFHASTQRKIAVYDWLATRLVRQLKDFAFSQYDGGYYFFKEQNDRI